MKCTNTFVHFEILLPYTKFHTNAIHGINSIHKAISYTQVYTDKERFTL